MAITKVFPVVPRLPAASCSPLPFKGQIRITGQEFAANYICCLHQSASSPQESQGFSDNKIRVQRLTSTAAYASIDSFKPRLRFEWCALPTLPAFFTFLQLCAVFGILRQHSRRRADGWISLQSREWGRFPGTLFLRLGPLESK